MEFIDHPSPNFSDREGNAKPSLVIIHFTSKKSTEDALDTLTDGKKEKPVSSHYLIDEEGRIYRLVDEEKRAWHAGVSFWNGVMDVNSASIGIEISNRRYQPYTKAQLESLIELCHDIQRRHNIPAENIVGHSDIAPNRKDDPGYHFPWAEMAKKNIGVIPKVKLRDKFRAASFLDKPGRLKKLFRQAGYGDCFGMDTTPLTLEHLIKAFQQHYTPEVYAANSNDVPGKPTAVMIAQLRAVARHNRKHRKFS